MRYPPARRLDLVEELHGFRVADPYRWLEDAETEDTEGWSKAQDELLAEWMDGRPGREALRRRLERLLGAGLVSSGGGATSSTRSCWSPRPTGPSGP